MRLHRPLFFLLGLICLLVALYFYAVEGAQFREYGLPLLFGVALCWGALSRNRTDG